jgi:adenine phosphoribosyltransferase
MNLDDHIRSIPDFPKPGINFKDIAPLLEEPEAMRYCIDTIAAQYAGEADKIAAFDARGFLFGAPLAYTMGLPLVPIRKKGKLPYECITAEYGLEYGKDAVQLHVDAIAPGERVLMIDDLLATGGTMEAGCALVERLGGNIIGCQFIIELEGLGGRERLGRYDVSALLSYGA